MFVLLRGPKVRRELPALAAQLRAFSSLLSLPSQAQSVIKAFRRQGIGFADVVNNVRFLLSRIESLSATPTSHSFLRFRSKSSNSSKGGQTGPLRVPAARLCDLFRSAIAPLHKPHRLAYPRISAVAFVILSVGMCQSRKDPYLPLQPSSVRLLPRTHVLACSRFQK